MRAFIGEFLASPLESLWAAYNARYLQFL